MNIKNLVCAAVVAFCVLGCASGPRFVTAKDCPGNSCDIAVSVVTGSDGKPRIVLEDNGNLRMGRGNRDTVIVWQLKDSPDYKFERDTIAPHTGAPVADKQTTSREAWNDQITFVRNSAVNFIVENRNTSKVVLYYDVKVYPKGHGAPVTLDPAIMNDP